MNNAAQTLHTIDSILHCGYDYNDDDERSRQAGRLGMQKYVYINSICGSNV